MTSAGMVWDTHVHLERYGERAPSLVGESVSAGVGRLVAVSMDLASSERTAALAASFPGVVLPAYGFHPEQPLPDAAALEALFAWMEARAERGERFAVGEVGLPYYSRQEAAEAGRAFDEAPYLALLDRFVAFAARRGLPIALHAVYEDAGKACDALERHGAARAHFHWFKGDDETLARIVRGGWYVSFTPDCLYDPETRPLLARVPLERMLAETDGPWPFEGPYAGRETHPAMTADVARAIAAAKGLPEDTVVETLARNARRCYE
ncbi:TatD family hydrolase [Paenibacillus sp.]|uniref:TatD family hydrolase n=1 Tax=Paenibacillus sp. TaxID=58172 RepID=UPI002D5EAD61|nr:TatD family hydrolase [Paenibacillus sp.]HZG57628.1 TatD family hydrolase [Paenibacillus sp.]